MREEDFVEGYQALAAGKSTHVGVDVLDARLDEERLVGQRRLHIRGKPGFDSQRPNGYCLVAPD